MVLRLLMTLLMMLVMVLVMERWHQCRWMVLLLGCFETVHPRGPVEGAYYHYASNYPFLLLLSMLLSVNSLCPEAVHPRGPAEVALLMGRWHQYRRKRKR